jgi:hypothetical protein
MQGHVLERLREVGAGQGSVGPVGPDGPGADLVGELSATLLAEGLAGMRFDPAPDLLETHDGHTAPSVTCRTR